MQLNIRDNLAERGLVGRTAEGFVAFIVNNNNNNHHHHHHHHHHKHKHCEVRSKYFALRENGRSSLANSRLCRTVLPLAVLYRKATFIQIEYFLFLIMITIA
jgi:hypothetical protein